MSVFIPEIGFRPDDAVGIREPVTETKDDGRALRVMRLVSTAYGTELGFEVRDPERERACVGGKVDYHWASRCEVRLRDLHGQYLKPIAGEGNASSMGQHDFGFFGKRAVFEPLAPDADRVTLELRGELGAWDVPLSVVPLREGGALAVAPIRAEETRNGVTVRVLAIATTDDAIAIDVEADPGVKTNAIEIGEWMLNQGRDGFALMTEDGSRLEELSMRDRMGMKRMNGRTVVLFPRTDARALTLVVPAVVFQECGSELTFDLPIYAPVDLDFGRYRTRIRYASAVDNLAAAPGEASEPGIEIQVGSSEWFEDRRVLRAGRVQVDGAFFGYGTSMSRDPGTFNVNIRMLNPSSAQRVTMRDPVVAVRGPWEIRFTRP